jgi:hypothetical protein
MLLAALWVAFGLVWLPFAAEAQQAKLPRLGFLASHSPSWPPYQTFLQTLRELGYVEGKNIAIEARYAQDNFGRRRLCQIPKRESGPIPVVLEKNPNTTQLNRLSGRRSCCSP